MIRALRRMGQNELANQLRRRMLRSLYPETLTIDRIPLRLDLELGRAQSRMNSAHLESLSRLYLDLSAKQRRYPLFLIVDDLPVQLPKTLGQALGQISLTRALAVPGIEDRFVLEALRNAIDLLRAS
jgi:hypothetical protein